MIEDHNANYDIKLNIYQTSAVHLTFDLTGVLTGKNI